MRLTYPLPTVSFVPCRHPDKGLPSIHRYRYEMWARWNYILAAAFDAGFNVSTLPYHLLYSFFSSEVAVTLPVYRAVSPARQSETILTRRSLIGSSSLTCS